MPTLRFKASSLPPDMVAHVEKSLESVPHVRSVHIESDSALVVIEHDGADPVEVAAALREEGISAREE